MMNKFEEYVNLTKLGELIGKKDEVKKNNPWICALAIIGAVVAVAAIAYAIYRFCIPDYMEDYDDFEDFEDFEDLEEDLDAEL